MATQQKEQHNAHTTEVKNVAKMVVDILFNVTNVCFNKVLYSRVQFSSLKENLKHFFLGEGGSLEQINCISSQFNRER